MTAALIGSTGFVGGNLLRQREFDETFHSRNIGDIAGRSYERIVCAGAPGTKWKANREPERDRAAIQWLTEHLGKTKAEHLVLISTVDIYPEPRCVDEDAAIDESAAAPYGRHRRELERFVTERFDATVLRLPALFGPGLKKNVIYDLIHDHQVDRIQPATELQLYDLAWLADDIDRVCARGIALLNVATEPLVAGEIARDVFGRELPERDGPIARYDFRSKHADALGGAAGYLYDRAHVLAALQAFVKGAG